METQQDIVVCTIKGSIAIDMNMFGVEGLLTHEKVCDAKPQVQQVNSTADFYVWLNQKPCGKFNPMTSKTLSSVLTLKLAKIKSFVSLDKDLPNHTFTLIQLLAPADNILTIIHIVAASYGSHLNSYVIIPPIVLLQQGVLSFLERNKKRPFQAQNVTLSSAVPVGNLSSFIQASKFANIQKQTLTPHLRQVKLTSSQMSGLVNTQCQSDKNASIESLLKTVRSQINSINQGLPSSTVATTATTLSSKTNNTSLYGSKQVINKLLPFPTNVSQTNTCTNTTVTNVIGTMPSINNWTNIKIKQEKEDRVVSSTTITPISLQSSLCLTTSSFCMETQNIINMSSTACSSINSLPTTINCLQQSILGNVSSISSMLGSNVCQTPSIPESTIEGEATNMSDLPSNILQKLQVFSDDAHSIRQEQNTITRLLDERESGQICGFLLGKVDLPKGDEPGTSYTDSPGLSIKPDPDNDELISNSDDDDDDDECVNFSNDFMQRHRNRRKHPTAHIGSNVDELYDDPADVSYKNWGLSPASVDPADVMFVDTPPPVVKKNSLDELFDMMSEFPKDVEMEPCWAIKQKLLLHQKMALFWMVERENTKELPPFWECISINRDYFNTATRQRLYEKPECVNGGILADDMGLGKTLTTISLILTNHVNGKPMFNEKKKLPTVACDIVEKDDIQQKMLTIKRKKDGYVKPNATTKSEFNKPGYKFRQLYLQQLGKGKKKKKKKEKQKEDSMFLSDSDDEEKSLQSVTKHVHSIIHGPSLASNSTGKSLFGQQAIDRKSTLIVCPMSVLSNWTDQFQQHVNPTIHLQIYVFYGPERVCDVNFLKKHDVVITTYSTLACDFKAKTKQSPLHQINWLRVVLDEGHCIRNARAQQTAAMIGLNASRRWLLTGTPIQNRLTDLWSLIKFLRLEPFTNRKWWFEFVVSSMKRKAKPGEVIFNRVQKIIKHIAIRRLKTDKINDQPIVKLPERRVVIQKIKFSEDERNLYDAMQKDGKLIICKYFRMNTVMKNYASVLVIIMRLRQLCCHPKLCAKAVEKLQKAMDMMDQFKEQLQGDDDTGDDIITEGDEMTDELRGQLIQQLMQLLSSGDSEECSICLEQLQDPIITKCAHVFCSNCINEVMGNAEIVATCPLCRAEIDHATMLKVTQVSKLGDDDEASKQQVNDEDNEQWYSSAKIDAVLEALIAQRKKDPFMKSLVVSQFTSFLDVLEKPLKNERFSFVRLDGRMSQNARVQVIDAFHKDDDYAPTVMLLSLTAGGVGLNLTAANRVFLLDPAWNPAIEEQCFDRCHRLGQEKDVLVIKFIVENTVEDRMLILQQQKRELMQRAFGVATKSPEERRAAALRDINTLLGLNLGGAGQMVPPPNTVPLGVIPVDP